MSKFPQFDLSDLTSFRNISTIKYNNKDRKDRKIDQNFNLSPYIGEFVGTFVFLFIILLVVVNISKPGWLIALLIGFGLALGIYICMLFKGPGYLNPLVAIMLGVKDQKPSKTIACFIAIELFALTAVVALYYVVPKLFIVKK